MMKIALVMGEEKKTFTVPFVKARMLRKAAELAEQMEDKDEGTGATMRKAEAMIDFVVELFNGQFTADDIWDGLSTDELFPELTRCFNEVMGTQKPDPNVRKRAR